MRGLVSFFVQRSLVVNLLTVAVCVLGGIVATITTRALLPVEKPSAVEVHAALPGASAMDMERLVTFRLEEALHGMEDVDRITSTTTNGTTYLRVKLEAHVESLTKALEEIRSRLSSIRHRLPEDLRPIRIIEEPRRNNQHLMGILVQNADEADPAHRGSIRALVERLRRIPNVIDVHSSVRDKDLYIRFSRSALDRLGLSVTDAKRRVLEYLSHMPVGSVQVRDQDVAIELSRPLGDIEGLRSLPLIVNRIGQNTTLGQVATIEYGFERERVRGTLGGERYVMVSVVNGLGTDVIEISREVRRVLETEGKILLPPPLSYRITVDASEAIGHEMVTLLGNGLGGILLVILILTLFLGWRVSAVTALGLPFCYLGLVLLLPLFDIDFNLISLVAMILVVGILVDDAIIVSEEYCQRLGKGESPTEAASNAVMDVGRPVLGMAATTTVAFLPLIFLKTEQSWLSRPLPIIIILALGLSLFESFFLLPNHLRHLMSKKAWLPKRRFIESLRERYSRLLSHALRFRYLCALLVFGLMGLAVWLVMGPVRFTGNENINADAVMYLELPEAAASLDEFAQKVKPVEELLESLPDELVDHYKTQLGLAWNPAGGTMRGWKYAQIRVFPKGTFDEQEAKRHVVVSALRDDLRRLEKSGGFERLRFREDAGKDVRDVVTIYVSGGDRIRFETIQEDIRASLGKVESVEDVFMDDSRFQRAFSFDVDEVKALSYGLSKRQVRAQLREHFSRHELLRFRNEGEEVKVFLGFQGGGPPRKKMLDALTVMSPKGVPVPMKMLGRWENVEVLRRIEHRDMLRMFQVDVLYDKEKVTGEEVAKSIEKFLEPVRKKFPGYHISVKPSEAAAESKSFTIKLILLCVGLIYLCLALSLNSLLYPIVVVLAIPFGFMGVVFAFYLHGKMLGIMAVVGILGLAGVVVNDSLVMASTIKDIHRDKPGGSIRDAILEGATLRFRAVLLTSVTTLGGVFPLAYGLVGKAGWFQPMVLALGWGLFAATILTLFSLPCLLLILDDIGRGFWWAWDRATAAAGKR
ncbi:efflux RND transporter permease subunit [Elusimicrobiota bacterium]